MHFAFDYNVTDASTRLPSERGQNGFDAMEQDLDLDLIPDTPRRKTSLQRIEQAEAYKGR